MGKQTSRIYGIKVKERVNYYEFGDEGGKITLSYESGVWYVKAGAHSGNAPADVEWWYNGHQIQNGGEIDHFSDGDVVTLHVMEQHKDSTPYVNLMYDIFGNAAMNTEYGDKTYTYRIVPGSKQYSCKVYRLENGIIKESKEFTSEDIQNYKRTYAEMIENPLYPVFNMKFDWHGMNPESGYLQMSFEAISDSNYIKYNGMTILKGETIRNWQGISFNGFEVTDESDKYHPVKVGEDEAPAVMLVKRKGGATLCSASKDKINIYSDVYYDHKDVYYNGKYHKAMYLVYDNPQAIGCWKKHAGALAITYADPYWFLMTSRAGVEYGGRTYEAQKLIRVWKPETLVDMQLRQVVSRKKAIPKGQHVEETVYDIQATSSSDVITVEKQKLTYVYNPSTGQDEKVYTTEDTTTFTPADAPINVYKLRFTFNISTNKWTIYSKSGYISYGGRLYPNNRSILSFGAEEDVHIEIKDETNRYIVDEIITYRVKTPDSDVTVGYSIHTPTNDKKCVKIIKSVGAEDEPWVTVYFYEAMYKPYEYDDISLLFHADSDTWDLYSNSDNLYYLGTNYKKGDLIGSWAYGYQIKVSNMLVTHPNHDSLQVKTTILVDGKLVTNVDVDEDIDWYDLEEPDFHIGYSYTKGLWTITAIHNCWMDGINYTTGTVIKQFKTRLYVDPFTMMFRHFDEGSDIPHNVLYSVTVEVDPREGVTTVTINSKGHNSESFSDKDISQGKEQFISFTKDDAKSMYGYIWKKFESPGPTPPSNYSFIVTVYYNYSSNSLPQYAYLYGIDPGINLDKVNLMASSYSYYVWKILKTRNDYGIRYFVERAYFINQYADTSKGVLHYTDDYGQHFKTVNPRIDFPTFTFAEGFIVSRNELHLALCIENEYTYTIVKLAKYMLGIDGGSLTSQEDVELPEDYYFRSSNINQIYTTDYTNSVIAITYGGSGTQYGRFNDYCFYDLGNKSLNDTLARYLNGVELEINRSGYCYASDSGGVVTDGWVAQDPGLNGNNWMSSPSHNLGNPFTLQAPRSYKLDGIWYLYIYLRKCDMSRTASIINYFEYEDIACYVIKYDISNNEITTVDVSSEDYANAYMIADRGYKKIFNNELYHYWSNTEDETLEIWKFNKENGMWSLERTKPWGSYINVLYSNRSTFIKLLIGETLVRLNAINTNECQIVAPFSDSNWLDVSSENLSMYSGRSAYNRKLTFKIINKNYERFARGVIFAFDNPYLESGNNYVFDEN